MKNSVKALAAAFCIFCLTLGAQAKTINTSLPADTGKMSKMSKMNKKKMDKMKKEDKMEKKKMDKMKKNPSTKM